MHRTGRHLLAVEEQRRKRLLVGSLLLRNADVKEEETARDAGRKGRDKDGDAPDAPAGPAGPSGPPRTCPSQRRAFAHVRRLYPTAACREHGGRSPQPGSAGGAANAAGVGSAAPAPARSRAEEAALREAVAALKACVERWHCAVDDVHFLQHLLYGAGPQARALATWERWLRGAMQEALTSERRRQRGERQRGEHEEREQRQQQGEQQQQRGEHEEGGRGRGQRGTWEQDQHRPGGGRFNGGGSSAGGDGSNSGSGGGGGSGTRKEAIDSFEEQLRRRTLRESERLAAGVHGWPSEGAAEEALGKLGPGQLLELAMELLAWVAAGRGSSTAAERPAAAAGAAATAGLAWHQLFRFAEMEAVELGGRAGADAGADGGGSPRGAVLGLLLLVGDDPAAGGPLWPPEPLACALMVLLRRLQEAQARVAALNSSHDRAAALRDYASPAVLYEALSYAPPLPVDLQAAAAAGVDAADADASPAEAVAEAEADASPAVAAAEAAALESPRCPPLPLPVLPTPPRLSPTHMRWLLTWLRTNPQHLAARSALAAAVAGGRAPAEVAAAARAVQALWDLWREAAARDGEGGGAGALGELQGGDGWDAGDSASAPDLCLQFPFDCLFAAHPPHARPAPGAAPQRPRPGQLADEVSAAARVSLGALAAAGLLDTACDAEATLRLRAVLTEAKSSLERWRVSYGTAVHGALEKHMGGADDMYERECGAIALELRDWEAQPESQRLSQLSGLISCPSSGARELRAAAEELLPGLLAAQPGSWGRLFLLLGREEERQEDEQLEAAAAGAGPGQARASPLRQAARLALKGLAALAGQALPCHTPLALCTATGAFLEGCWRGPSPPPASVIGPAVLLYEFLSTVPSPLLLWPPPPGWVSDAVLSGAATPPPPPLPAEDARAPPPFCSLSSSSSSASCCVSSASSSARGHPAPRCGDECVIGMLCHSLGVYSRYPQLAMALLSAMDIAEENPLLLPGPEGAAGAAATAAAWAEDFVAAQQLQRLIWLVAAAAVISSDCHHDLTDDERTLTEGVIAGFCADAGAGAEVDDADADAESDAGGAGARHRIGPDTDPWVLTAAFWRVAAACRTPAAASATAPPARPPPRPGPCNLELVGPHQVLLVALFTHSYSLRQGETHVHVAFEPVVVSAGAGAAGGASGGGAAPAAAVAAAVAAAPGAPCRGGRPGEAPTAPPPSADEPRDAVLLLRGVQLAMMPHPRQPEYEDRYEWNTIYHKFGSMVVTATSRLSDQWRRVEAALVTRRLGSLWIFAEGALGLLRALQLAARAREALLQRHGTTLFVAVVTARWPESDDDDDDGRDGKSPGGAAGRAAGDGGDSPRQGAAAQRALSDLSRMLVSVLQWEADCAAKGMEPPQLLARERRRLADCARTLREELLRPAAGGGGGVLLSSKVRLELRLMEAEPGRPDLPRLPLGPAGRGGARSQEAARKAGRK
ncbi:hypothetical protein GPECTOR_76g784 [Gonium pectorale]|uniref:Uncharacterized protein n=1 Tax=Gonium pectorale TaxID=33097 RepID=A0A150G2A7_GONPE|nr:hypothetical protein GPECTOR_76g784 [Gonium pectorale]|eukprot:KXZ43963.1 hypothetical protein GPECTOR_76g784 [Gonium pectorale]